MDLERLFLKRQSTREYDSKPVSEEQIKKICSLALLAPSACNGQPYKLYAVTGEKAKPFAENLKLYGRNGWTDNCPCFIVIEQKPPVEIKRGESIISNSSFIQNDVGILASYITLAAEDMDLQTCIIGLRNERGIAEFLNLPKDTKFPLVIALGHKAEGYPVREKHRNAFEDTFKLIK